MTGNTTRFIVPVALKEVMERLVPDFERESGHRIETAVMLNPDVPGYIAAGATWGAAITNPWHVEEILVAGHGARSSHRPFGRSPLAFGMRDGTGGSRHRSGDLAALLPEAESIAFTAAGTSGKSFLRLIETLGIRDSLQPRLRPMAGGEPMAALIAGEVALAALPLTNIAPVRGVFPAAICPVELGVHIDLSLCVSRNASRAALELAEWLLDPALDGALERLGAKRFSLAER